MLDDEEGKKMPDMSSRNLDDVKEFLLIYQTIYIDKIQTIYTKRLFLLMLNLMLQCSSRT